MNEAKVNETQPDYEPSGGPVGDDAPVAGDEGVGLDEELLRQTHLSAMLTELVRRDGPTKVAEKLGVNYKTVARFQKSGKVTDHMREALEQLLGLSDAPQPAGEQERIGALEESVKRLEGGMDTLARELRAGLEEMRTAVAGQSEAPSVDEAQDRAKAGGPRTEGGEGGEGAGRSETRAAPPPADEPPPRKRWRPRRSDPEVVTEQPAEDDAEVYGEAWPLVEEWRRVRDGHPYEGKSLWWLTTYERLLVLELAMLEDHGLTLPPETQALRGFGRRGQTSWRWKALADTRLALRKRKLLRWVMPWLWREKAPEFPPGPVPVRR